MSGWMPSTEQVREAYSIDPMDEYRDPISAPANRRANERYFDRWLAAHDERVRTEERERCLAIIDGDRKQRIAAMSSLEYFDSRWEQGAVNAADTIAAAIRAVSEQEEQ